MNLLIRILQFVLNVLTKTADAFTTRRISDSEARLKKHVGRLKKTVKDREAAIAGLQAKIEESSKARRKSVTEYGEQKRIAADVQAQNDELRLTLQERSAYISDVEAASQKKDTEIGLLRLELETLTLWRENVNQQLRTEADIAAAKSQVLQGRNADRTLENLKNVDDKKDTS